jgi:hypothetical protein
MTQAQTPSKSAPVVETVTMADGRVVEFSGKRRFTKESFLHADGQISVRIDFRNGVTRTFNLPAPLLAKFAAHGAEQKLGDEMAGLEDLDDMVVAMDSLIDRLNDGNWTAPRQAGAGQGGSILLKALQEARPNLSTEQVRKFLDGKTHAEKLALRKSAALSPIIARLEAEKAAKKPQNAIDGDALLDSMG